MNNNEFDISDEELKEFKSQLKQWLIFDQILQVENHIRTLEDYNLTLEDLTDPILRQNKTAINLIGSIAVPNSHKVELQGNTIDLLQDSLYKKYKVKTA